MLVQAEGTQAGTGSGGWPGWPGPRQRHPKGRLGLRLCLSPRTDFRPPGAEAHCALGVMRDLDRADSWPQLTIPQEVSQEGMSEGRTSDTQIFSHPELEAPRAPCPTSRAPRGCLQGTIPKSGQGFLGRDPRTLMQRPKHECPGALLTQGGPGGRGEPKTCCPSAA